jgi:hypothetical protein
MKYKISKKATTQAKDIKNVESTSSPCALANRGKDNKVVISVLLRFCVFITWRNLH